MRHWCTKCNKEIYDRVIMFIDHTKPYHFDCLTCEKCLSPLGNQMGNNRCYFKDGMVLCKSDYIRMMTAICSGCNAIVAPDAYVHKINCLPINNINERNTFYSKFLIYHPSCLKCFKCQNFLKKGDKYILKPDNLGIVCLNNECANDFGINISINQAPTQVRKRGRQANTNSVKVKVEKTQQNQFNQM